MRTGSRPREHEKMQKQIFKRVSFFLKTFSNTVLVMGVVLLKTNFLFGKICKRFFFRDFLALTATSLRQVAPRHPRRLQAAVFARRILLATGLAQDAGSPQHKAISQCTAALRTLESATQSRSAHHMEPVLRW